MLKIEITRWNAERGHDVCKNVNNFIVIGWQLWQLNAILDQKRKKIAL